MPDFIRKFFFNRALKKLTGAIEADLLDHLLQALLEAMRLLFLLDKDYRRNITGFQARYAFQSRDGEIAASAIFDGKKMSVKKNKIDKTNVTIIFKDGNAMTKFLFSKNPDIIAAVLDNEVTYDGNLNYLAKFAFMAKHLQLKFAL